MRKILKSLSDLLFPYYRCPSCNEEHEGVCPSCLEKSIRYGECRLDDTEGVSMYFYKGAPERMIYRFKKDLKFNALKGLTELMIAFHEGYIENETYGKLMSCDVLTYIPSTRANIRKRGFDPGRMLCERYSDISGIPMARCLKNMSRKENKKMNLIQRRENAEKGIVLDSSCTDLIKGRRVLIFDDIMTTGSTMRNAVRRVMGSGAESVYFISLMKSTV